MMIRNIPDYLKNHDIKPSSLSSVEKRLSQLKETLDLKSNEQLVGFFKDLGSI